MRYSKGANELYIYNVYYIGAHLKNYFSRVREYFVNRIYNANMSTTIAYTLHERIF